MENKKRVEYAKVMFLEPAEDFIAKHGTKRFSMPTTMS